MRSYIYVFANGRDHSFRDVQLQLAREPLVPLEMVLEADNVEKDVHCRSM